MSGKHSDILDLIEDDEKKEAISRLLPLISSYRPQVRIDRDFQRTLKSDLMKSRPRESGFFTRTPWSLISSTGLICTSFLLVFGLWKIWSPGLIGIQNGEKASLSTITSPQNSSSKVDTLVTESDGYADSSSATPSQYDNEKTKIDTDIASISEDILSSLDGEDSESIENLSQSISPMNAMVSSDTSQENTLSPEIFPVSMMTKMSPLPIETMIDTRKRGVDIPQYPSIMMIYMKPSLWTVEEISSRGGFDVISKPYPTEKNSIITRKVELLLEGKKVISSDLIYRKLEKIARDDMHLFYLVPILEYTTSSGETIGISLIRGFR